MREDQRTRALRGGGMSEPLFLLHTGQIDSGGEQDEWDCEADSGRRVDAFCRLHPGQTILLYPADAIREAVLAERERCCGIIYGMCESDNVAQRTVDAIKGGVA